jgi:colicin import membrane protein
MGSTMSFPTEPPPGAEKGPWYKRWWGIALIVLFALAFVGAVTDPGDETTEVVAAADASEGIVEPEVEPEADELTARQIELAKAAERIEQLKEEYAAGEEEREKARLEREEAAAAEEEAAREAEQEAREAKERAAREKAEEEAREAEERAAREKAEEEAREAEEQVAREAVSASQNNALRAARNYISIMPFSRSGLIKQLEFEGYSTGDATYAVDELAPNWNEQAAKAAKNYLDIMPFSRSGLIDQLVFEGYTRDQATYGVNQTGL